MSLRALPLIVIAFVLYNVIVLLGGAEPIATLGKEIFSIPMISKGRWVFTWGDFILLLTFLLLFIELLKSTYTSTASLLDHGLSMLVFVVCLIEFIVVPQAATSVFFLIMVATLIDVVAGYTIGIRVARRDLNIGGEA
ncbi:MAG: hypothetical protein ABL904_17650 [Hyphomicrobiaceae bacterium]